MARLDKDHGDAYFVQMVLLIAEKHNCTVEIDAENRVVNFLDGNVTQQVLEDLMTLFEDYCVD